MTAREYVEWAERWRRHKAAEQGDKFCKRLHNSTAAGKTTKKLEATT